MCLDMVLLTDCLIIAFGDSDAGVCASLEVMVFLELSLLPLGLTDFIGIEKTRPWPTLSLSFVLSVLFTFNFRG